jgi:hypothetical protein
VFRRRERRGHHGARADTTTGWGYSNNFSSNYDAIFKKPTSADSSVSASAADKATAAAGSKASSHDAIFGKGRDKALSPSEVLTPAGLLLLARDEVEFMAVVAAAKNTTK